MKFLFLGLIISVLLSCESSSSADQHLTSEVAIERTIDTTNDTEQSDVLVPLDSLINKGYLLGKFDYKKHPLFQKLPDSLSNKEIYLNSEVLTAFANMHQEALKANISLRVVSGTRNFDEQKTIWENKWKKEDLKNHSARQIALKILEYSSMPSTSRHHWGTDVDINSVESSYFRKEPGLTEYAWLTKNAHRFGFYQTYTSKENGRTGYSVEEWHWSYLPLSDRILELYNRTISNNDIIGFTGCETAAEIDIIGNYVNGIEKY